MEEKNKNILSRRALRSLIFHIIYAVDRFDYSEDLKTIIENFNKGFGLDLNQDSQAILIAKEIIENKENLDNQIKPFLKNWTLDRIGCCTKLILRLALWELNQPDAIPSVIINEAIELAKAFAEKDAYKFINGLLDEYCKQKGLKNEKLEKNTKNNDNKEDKKTE